ncbi:MAG: tyrosine-protein phosphatase [Deltaproteobacteria bacterium]|nr:tyrosine-protein phosphatase [Deltaproteobacteria bacterium]
MSLSIHRIVLEVLRRVSTAVLLCALAKCAIDVSPQISADRSNRARDRREPTVAELDSGEDMTTVDGGNVGETEAAVDAGVEVASVTDACQPGRWILEQEVANARDLGGTPVAGGATVGCDLIYRGSMLTDLSRQGCQAFEQLAIRSVIDLRTPSERADVADAECIEEWATVVRAPMPTPYSVSPQDYLADLYTADSVAAAFDLLGDPDAYPIYISCIYGRDRTGVLVAVILLALGAPADVVLAEYELTRESGLSSYPASLEAVLEEIERIGGVQGYLLAMGVSMREIETLRSQALVY